MTVALRALLLGALVAVASPAVPAVAQSQSEPTQAPQADAAGAASEAPAAATPAQAVPGVPAPKALPPEIAGECAWVGKRIVSLLARDDVDTSKRFLEFYRLFGCDESHLAPAFRCVILESTNPASTNETSPEEGLSQRVDRCWAIAE